MAHIHSYDKRVGITYVFKIPRKKQIVNSRNLRPVRKENMMKYTDNLSLNFDKANDVIIELIRKFHLSYINRKVESYPQQWFLF